MTDRLVIAYVLLAILGAEFVGVLWWQLYHSRRRTDAREQVRRRKAERILRASQPPP
jgi:hypothetical protein